MHLVGFIIRVYHDALSPERQTHKRETSTVPEGYELAIPASERPQTHTLDRAATGTGPIDTYQSTKFNTTLFAFVRALYY